MNSGKNLSYLISLIISYLNQALVLMMGFAVVMFVFYVIKYFMKPSDGEGRKEAASYVLYSVIGFFVILSFWGLVFILQNTFGLSNQAPGSWASFGNMFPGGGSSSYGGYSSGPFNGGYTGGTYSGSVQLPPDPLRQAIFGK